MSFRRKWPIEAEVSFTVRATHAQVAKWRQEAFACGHQHVETFIVAGADFLAWWWGRERVLQGEKEEQMRKEARERPEMKPCQDG